MLVFIFLVAAATVAPHPRFSKVVQSATFPISRFVHVLPATTRTFALRFDVNRHGFSFSNWAGLTPEDTLTYANMARLFSTNAECAEGPLDSSCLLRSGQRIDLSAANSFISTGRCEGMVVLAGLLYSKPKEIKRIDPIATTAIELTKETSADEIAYYSLAQVLPKIRQFTVKTLRKQPYIIGREIALQIRIKKLVSLGIYGDGFGHSVLPIRVKSSPRKTVITVYDPNFPGQINTLTINNILGIWTYDRAVLADGTIGTMTWKGAGKLDYVPIYLRPKN